MGLKQSIVIKNEFSVKSKATGKGSRGSTPGNYVSGYMARSQAGEGITPVRLMDADSYIVRYMAREGAVDSAESVYGLKEAMKGYEGYGGQAFGYGDPALSDERLKACSKDIQSQFDRGKTVFKTVLSFSNEYLQEMKVVPEGFEPEHPGDYRGNVDQLRLRLAIMNGLKKIEPDYDDLRYVGVIQVDTMHVHCHLAMVDAGRGNVLPNGEQKGMLSSKQREKFRHGIDLSLDENKTVKHLSQDVQAGQRNALCYIKKYTHKVMDQNGPPQFLLACLPEDRRLWRADTNRKEMRKPNAILTDYVREVFKEPDSGYGDALRSIDAYARGRQQREGLSDERYRQLYERGQKQLMSDCINGVYAVLKTIPKEEEQVRTPMLSVMSEDYEEMASQAASDPMIEFGFKLRSYSSRLDYHKKESHKWRDMRKEYEKVPDPNPMSAALLMFIKNEEEYNAKLMCKYQYFLDFLPPRDDYEEEFEELMKYRQRMRDLDRMREDKSLLRMKPENAEEYGISVYGQRGGQYVLSAPWVLERRRERMQERCEEQEAAFRERIADYGLSLSEYEGRLAVSKKKPYEFDEVKALDIHHLGYDFPYDAPISRLNIDRFAEAAYTRYALYGKAKEYLEKSGQAEQVKYLPGKDVEAMKETADSLTRTGTIPTKVKPSEGGRRNVRTVPLDYQLDIKTVVKAAVQGASIIE